MKKSGIQMLFAVAAIGLLFSGCRKDKGELAETIISAEDNSTAENEFTSLFDLGDDFSTNDRRVRSGNTILPGGAVVIFQDSLFSDGDGIECTIDFGPLKPAGPKGMLCMDGRYRAGVIHLRCDKRYLLDSSSVVITAHDSDKFYGGSDGVNMTQITGTLTMTRLSQTSVKINVSDARAVNDKGTVAWQSSRTVSKTSDAGPGILGDRFEITGEASGVNRNGESFTVKIDVPLVKKVELGCARTFVKGKITLTNTASGKNIIIDYDPFNNEACDLTAKATVNNKEYFYVVR